MIQENPGKAPINQKGSVFMKPTSIFLSLIHVGVACSVISGCQRTHKNDKNESSDSGEKPNIIFIMADDIGYNDLASYGQQSLPTPSTDQLAQEGMRFTDAHAHSAVSSPTRYSVLTGTDPFRQYHTSHVLFNGEPLVIGKQESTVASLLQQGGYSTGVIGKWHVGLGDTIPRDINHSGRGPNETGFDYSFLIPDGHNMDPKYYIENGQVVRYTPHHYRSKTEILDRVGYKLVQHIPSEEWKNRRPGDKISAMIADKADAFIEKNKDQPFFLYYPTHTIHWPFTPGSQFAGKSGINPLADFILEFDWLVGRIMKTLDRLGLANNTLLIVTSDNGGYGKDRYNGTPISHNPNHPWRGHKSTAYEGGHRVPFIARWPGYIEPGSTNDETISLVDLTATLCAMANIKLQPDDALDSYNMLPALLNEDHKDIRNYTVMGTRGMEKLVLRQGPWKLIYAHEDEKMELYHLDEDSTERNDLSDTHPKMVKKLQDSLFHYFESGASRPNAKATGNSLDNILMQREERNRMIQKRFGDSSPGK